MKNLFRGFEIKRKKDYNIKCKYWKEYRITKKDDTRLGLFNYLSDETMLSPLIVARLDATKTRLTDKGSIDKQRIGKKQVEVLK